MNNKSPHLVIIGYVWPEPDSSAAGSRMMQLVALFLQNQWNVTFASPAADSEHMVDLGAIDVQKITIQLNHPSFDVIIQQIQPSIVLFDRFMMEEQFGWRVAKYCPDALRVLDTEDLHSLRYVRQQAFKSGIPFTIDMLKQGDITKREVASIFRCDLSLMTSATEVELLATHFNVPPTLLHHLPFMLETIAEKTISGWPHYIQREHFITIGNFRHEPNWDAVLYLKEEIWPLIRKQLPNAQLHVYGAYPPPKANALHHPEHGFYIKGWTADVNSVMTQARVCLAPLRFGAGIKGKLTDAMRCGTPNVTTTIGAESMSGKLPWSGIITKTSQAFADAAVQIYTNQQLWKEAQQNGIHIINQQYPKEQLGEDLFKHLTTLTQNIKSHRTHNFTGAMLLHHTMQSTKYMSRWIEEKNKTKDLKIN